MSFVHHSYYSECHDHSFLEESITVEWSMSVKVTRVVKQYHLAWDAPPLASETSQITGNPLALTLLIKHGKFKTLTRGPRSPFRAWSCNFYMTFWHAESQRCLWACPCCNWRTVHSLPAICTLNGCYVTTFCRITKSVGLRSCAGERTSNKPCFPGTF